jgi:hypothetical protein
MVHTVIPALRRIPNSQLHSEFQDSLGYIVRPWIKKKKKKKKKRKGGKKEKKEGGREEGRL